MYIGPYEDPTIADAFSNENTITTGQAQNPMIVSSGRNLVQVQLEVEKFFFLHALKPIDVRFVDHLTRQSIFDVWILG